MCNKVSDTYECFVTQVTFKFLHTNVNLLMDIKIPSTTYM